jgi:hypothetical protein
MREFQGQEFPIESVEASAASLPSYAAGGTHLWGAVTRRQLEPGRARDVLFPGLVVVVLGVMGLAAAPRRYRWAGLAVALGGVWLSLGPETALYRWLHEHVVVVRSVRVLTRFALLPMLVLSVLAGLALSGRHRLVVGLALFGMMAESSNLPLSLSRYDGPPPAARWLAGREGAVVYLPVGDVNTRAMLDGLAHLRPLVNGGGAFVPRSYDRALDMLGKGTTLDEEGLRFLRSVDVRHVVTSAKLDLPEAASFDDETIFDVPAGPSASVVEAGTPVPTRWTRHHATLDLGETRPVSRIIFTVGDGPWPSRVRVQSSLDGETWETVDATASLADATLSLYRDPRHGRGAVTFPEREARLVRVDRGLPMRPGALEVGR